MNLRMLRPLLWIAVVGVLFYDTGAVLVNRWQLEQLAADAAQAATFAWRQNPQPGVPQRAVEQHLANQRGVTVSELKVRDGILHLALTRPAGVILAKRLSFLDGLVVPVVRRDRSLPP